jgi:hypothetical protein
MSVECLSHGSRRLVRYSQLLLRRDISYLSSLQRKVSMGEPDQGYPVVRDASTATVVRSRYTVERVPSDAYGVLAPWEKRTSRAERWPPLRAFGILTENST